jgi:hypothetical protein
VRAVVVHMAHLLHKLRQPSSVPATSTLKSSVLQASTASSTTSSLVLASAAQQDWLALENARTASSSVSSSSAAGEPLALHHRQHLALEALQLYVPVSNALGLGAAFRELEELGYKVSVCVFDIASVVSYVCVVVRSSRLLCGSKMQVEYARRL